MPSRPLLPVVASEGRAATTPATTVPHFGASRAFIPNAGGSSPVSRPIGTVPAGRALFPRFLPFGSTAIECGPKGEDYSAKSYGLTQWMKART